MKKQIPARVQETTIAALKEEAKGENRTFSNHVDTVLTKHVEKKEQAKHVAKKEYWGGKENDGRGGSENPR